MLLNPRSRLARLGPSAELWARNTDTLRTLLDASASRSAVVRWSRDCSLGIPSSYGLEAIDGSRAPLTALRTDATRKR
jgi:hypothetical protein